MTLHLKLRHPLTPFGWAVLIILAVTFAVSAWVTPRKGMLAGWRAQDLSTVLPARIKPSTTFAVATELRGKVTAVLVAPGTHVKEGELLATLESDELDAELERAQRRVKFAESRKASLRPRRHNNAKRLQAERYQSALRAKKAARERLSGFSVGDMEKVWQEAKSRTAQIRSLVDQQLATSAELDDAISRERNALSSLKAAREHLSRLKQEAEIADSQLRETRADTPTSADGDGLLAAEMELEDAREALRQIKLRERAKNVMARRGGTVLRAEVRPGDRVAAGGVLFQIADLTELNFEVPVTAAVAEQVHPGRPVVVRIPTDPPRSQTAEVNSVLLSPDQDHTSYIVRITIPNPNPAAVLAGLEGAVEFPHLDSKWKRRPSY